MKEYTSVEFHNISAEHRFRLTDAANFTPVCVEVDDSAERLYNFIHPDNPIYVFGPEDGSVPTGIRHVCHRFVTIPSKSCLNLAAAVNVVLYDRAMKMEV
jgi:tRNA(Leu) C34 or U34 (ribose-2'-O)-methylase TrmL